MGQMQLVNRTILIVDDEPVLREMTSRILLLKGCQVLTADSGEEALTIYQQCGDEIDAIILDMIMPGIGGMECFRKIKGLDANAKVAIVSGYIQEESLNELKALGSCEILAKPYRSSDLLKCLEELLAA